MGEEQMYTLKIIQKTSNNINNSKINNSKLILQTTIKIKVIVRKNYIQEVKAKKLVQISRA